MKALTLWRPWAQLVASGTKLIENRPWRPPADFVGELFAIHAGNKWDQEGAERAGELLGQWRGTVWESDHEWEPDDHIAGAVLAVARVVDVVEKKEQIPMREQRPWFFGPFGWVLHDVTPIDPVVCRGWQKLWTLDDDSAENVLRQVARQIGGRER